MKQGDMVNRENNLKCPNCKNELEEEYQGNFYFSKEIDGEILEYDEEISRYTCKNCGCVYKGNFFEKSEDNIELIWNNNSKVYDCPNCKNKLEYKGEVTFYEDYGDLGISSYKCSKYICNSCGNAYKEEQNGYSWEKDNVTLEQITD